MGGLHLNMMLSRVRPARSLLWYRCPTTKSLGWAVGACWARRAPLFWAVEHSNRPGCLMELQYRWAVLGWGQESSLW